MNTKQLGLPFDYQTYPEYFDVLNPHENEAVKNQIVADLLKTHHVKTVLDMTCGTGSQVFYLIKRGYKVVGSDFSPALLKIARKKARTEKLKITWIDGDMRTLKAGAFDAVITIGNAIGHLTKKDFLKAMKNIYKHLKPGGIYIFDIFNLNAMTNKTVSELSCYTHKKCKEVQIHTVQYSTIDKASGLLTSYDTCVLQKNAEKPQKMDHTFSLQIYTPKELRCLLLQAGFETIGQYDINGKKLAPRNSLNIITLAKKT